MLVDPPVPVLVDPPVPVLVLVIELPPEPPVPAVAPESLKAEVSLPHDPEAAPTSPMVSTSRCR